MKIFWCCFAATLITFTNAAVDVEKTIQHVQSILKSNSLLPRLTREEIIELLNDIRAEDAISKPTTKVKSTATKTTTAKAAKKRLTTATTTTTTTGAYKNIQENEINTATQPGKLLSNAATVNNDISVSASVSTTVESTTKSSGSTLTVVLPYTPRDGSSLQELYTKPPRLQVVKETTTPKSIKRTKPTDERTQTPKNKANTLNSFDIDLPAELQAFLDSHGLKGKSGQNNFLLPLEGFKPLPPPKIVDGTVQLPENLLLTYDLISPSDLTSTSNRNGQNFAQTNYLYEPLRPQFPFELDTSSSQHQHSVLPLDFPKPRKPKAVITTGKPNFEPLDYEAVKVIPLNKGPNPIEDEVIVGIDQSKRQTNETDESKTTTTSTTEATNVETETKNVDSIPPDAIPDSDTGASIADLEDSFGGAAPVVPGDSELPPPKKNGFYWMVDWNSFLEVGDGDTKVNIRFEPKLGDPQMFLPVNVP